MTDADSAMAYFYRSLNSWVVPETSGVVHSFRASCSDARTKANTCQNNFCRVEFPLTFQLTFVVWVCGKTVHILPSRTAHFTLSRNFPEVKVA
ncbi:MAG: hypothetical protein JWM08_183 [Candidatus Angelobacter sp.]|nr:hypothetical protein [Candidatus Angelobacter sp.]